MTTPHQTATTGPAPRVRAPMTWGGHPDDRDARRATVFGGEDMPPPGEVSELDSSGPPWSTARDDRDGVLLWVLPGDMVPLADAPARAA